MNECSSRSKPTLNYDRCSTRFFSAPSPLGEGWGEAKLRPLDPLPNPLPKDGGTIDFQGVTHGSLSHSQRYQVSKSVPAWFGPAGNKRAGDCQVLRGRLGRRGGENR